jgi:hypothetical protein
VSSRQRTVPGTHDESVKKLDAQIALVKQEIDWCVCACACARACVCADLCDTHTKVARVPDVPEEGQGQRACGAGGRRGQGACDVNESVECVLCHVRLLTLSSQQELWKAPKDEAACKKRVTTQQAKCVACCRPRVRLSLTFDAQSRQAQRAAHNEGDKQERTLHACTVTHSHCAHRSLSAPPSLTIWTRASPPPGARKSTCP